MLISYLIALALILLVPLIVPSFAELRSIERAKKLVFQWLIPYSIIKCFIFSGLIILINNIYDLVEGSQNDYVIGQNMIFTSLIPIVFFLLLKIIYGRYEKVTNPYFYFYDFPTNLIISFCVNFIISASHIEC